MWCVAKVLIKVYESGDSLTVLTNQIVTTHVLDCVSVAVVLFPCEP